MNYQQSIEFLYKQYPAFEKQGGLAYKPGLDNVLGLSAAFDNPHTKFKSIHIAGTNGKGSCSNMLSSVLQEAGYSVGLYTSPHIHDFTERIRINGTPIPQEEVAAFVSKHTYVFDTFKPSFFEITTILAFDWFARQEVDIAIIETGMGGRLDATNIITPELCLITNVSFDHTQFLGDTLEKIATEKAGIIKQDIPVVISEYQTEIVHVFQSEARRQAAPLLEAYTHYTCIPSEQKHSGVLVADVMRFNEPYLKDLHCGLSGLYQTKNIIGVLGCVEELINAGWLITETNIREGFQHVLGNTGFKGRWQVLSEQPLIICDAAHNEAGIQQSMQQLAALQKERIHIVMGMVKDKSIQDVIALLPLDAFYYFCEADTPRALAADVLCAQAAEKGLKGIVEKNVNEALKKALAQASDKDVIWIGGSLYVLGELDRI